jgi:hypothetical protein
MGQDNFRTLFFHSKPAPKSARLAIP